MGQQQAAAETLRVRQGVAPAIRDARGLHAPAARAVLATEAGALGGCAAPVGRDASSGMTLFGAAQCAAAHLPAGSMMDLLQGGASLAILGMLQARPPAAWRMLLFAGHVSAACLVCI